MVDRTKIAVITTFALIVIVFVSTYFVIYKPLESKLENQIDHNFELRVENAQDISNTYFANIENSATSVSNRVLIKNKIAEYYVGTLTIEELSTFTDGYYPQSIADLNYLIDASRVVDDQVVVSFENDDYASHYIDYTTLTSMNDICVHEVMDSEAQYIVVVSPIVLNDSVLGYDLLVFDNQELLNSLQTEGYTFRIEPKDDELLSDLRKENGNVLYSLELEHSEFMITGSISYRELRSDTIEFSRNAIIYTAVVFFITFVGIAHMIIMAYSKMLKTVRTTSDEFEMLAKKDSLTKAWNRNFFIDWVENIESLENDEASIVMLDINDFKSINDNYGHVVGDDVLITLVKVISENLRSSDIISRTEENQVARYGGDEFTIFLPGCTTENAVKIMKKVEDSLFELTQFDFKITISYGIASYDSEKNIDDILSEADKLMYEMKHKKRA